MGDEPVHHPRRQRRRGGRAARVDGIGERGVGTPTGQRGDAQPQGRDLLPPATGRPPRESNVRPVALPRRAATDDEGACCREAVRTVRVKQHVVLERTEERHGDVEHDAEEPLALPRRGERGALDTEGPPAAEELAVSEEREHAEERHRRRGAVAAHLAGGARPQHAVLAAPHEGRRASVL
eukprot:scaffold95524_cov66-Phaeocystis_antarctica.AAC.2